MGMNADAAVNQLARALSDPLRIRIAAALIEQELTLDEVATTLGLRPAEVSRHLTLLRDSGIVTESVHEDRERYHLDLNELRRISRAAFASESPSSPEMDGDEWEQKVLRDFVKSDKLTSIPANRKKKLVILRWLSMQVPPDARLTEREVSRLLEQFHPDFATLRRELVDNGFLIRERGVYWRAGLSQAD